MKPTLFLFFLLVAGPMISQAEYLEEINTSWGHYASAWIANDYQKVTELTHPMVIEKSGGATYFINDLLYDAGMYASAGLAIKSLNAKQPSQVIQAGEELHAMLPYERIFQSGEEQIIEQHYALAASQDKGATWNFFDLSKQDVESIKIYLPHYDDRLSVYLNSGNKK